MAEQVLTQEEILGQLRTRGFDTFQGTPLRKFWGELESFTGEMRLPRNGGNPYLVVIRNFKNVEVLESTEPYTSPIAQLEWIHSSRDKSNEGYFGKSVDAIINADVPPDVMPPDPRLKGQDYLIGKMGLFELTPGNMMWDSREKKETPQECWKLIELRDGSAPAQPLPGPTPPGAQPTVPATPVADAKAQAIALLNGKTEQQWHQAAFNDPVIKADQAVVTSIVSRTFLDPYMMAGLVTKDEATGIYTVVQQ